MDQQEQLALIETYLVDETKMYQDWYKGLQQGQSESSMIPFAAKLPSDENIAKRFQVWFTEHKELLKVKICLKWKYQHQKAESRPKKFFILALADVLTFLGIPSAIATATWLEVKGYLDRICADCSEE